MPNFMDEPTTGLDPQTRLLIWDIIEKLRVEEKLTVFLTTHYMEEAANAGYVVILDKGYNNIGQRKSHTVRRKSSAMWLFLYPI